MRPRPWLGLYCGLHQPPNYKTVRQNVTEINTGLVKEGLGPWPVKKGVAVI